MSGPKLSAAELARLEQERLERERQEALKKLMEARDQYKKAISSFNTVKTNAFNSLTLIDAAYSNGLEQQLLDILNRIDNQPVVSSDPAIYLSAANKIENTLELIKREIADVLKMAQVKTDNDRDFSKRIIDLQDFSADENSCVPEIEPLRIDFSCHYNDLQLRKLLQDISSHFGNRLLSEHDSQLALFDKKALKTIQQLIDNSVSLDEAKKEVQLLINEEENQIRMIKEFNHLYEMYIALSLVLKITPKDKSQLSLEELKHDIDMLNNQYKQVDEMDYIADQINDVMINQGYSFVSSNVLRKKDSGETDYSLYRVNGGSGIAVYTDDTGAVMMRMTLLGDDSVITDADREFSYQNQIDFCARHSELVEALADRGVILKQKSYMAPDKKNTYKSMVSTKTSSDNQLINRRNRRRGGDQKMRAL